MGGWGKGVGGVAGGDVEVAEIPADTTGATEREAAVKRQAIRGKRNARDGHIEGSSKSSAIPQLRWLTGF